MHEKILYLSDLDVIMWGRKCHFFNILEGLVWGTVGAFNFKLRLEIVSTFLIRLYLVEV